MSEPQNKTVEAEETRPLITKLHIQNYKSLVDVELELGRFNVLIGENGCGKSNILEALTLGSLLPHAFIEYNDKISYLDYRTVYNRLVRVGKLDELKSKFSERYKESPIKINFVFGEEINLEYSIETELDAFQKEYLEFDRKISDGKYPQRSLNLLAGKTITISEFLHFQPSETVLREVNSESGQIPLGERGERLFDALEGLNEERLARLKESLQLINWFDDMEINYRHGIKREIKLKDKYFDELTPLLDFRHVNEGFLFILFYMVLFLHPQSPPFFGIDNLDTALNPKLASKLTSILTQMAKDYDKQVIVTTHNPMLLDGLDLDDDQVRLFVVYRNPDGHTNVRRFKPENKQVRLSEAWIRGYLGGLPMI